MRRTTLLVCAALFIVTAAVSVHAQAPTSEVTIALMCSGPADVTATTTVTLKVNGIDKDPVTIYCSGGPPYGLANANCASCHGLPNPKTPGRSFAKSIALAEGEIVTSWLVSTKVGPHDGTQKECVPGTGDSTPALASCRNDKYGATVHIN